MIYLNTPILFLLSISVFSKFHCIHKTLHTWMHNRNVNSSTRKLFPFLPKLFFVSVSCLCVIWCNGISLNSHVSPYAEFRTSLTFIFSGLVGEGGAYISPESIYKESHLCCVVPNPFSYLLWGSPYSLLKSLLSLLLYSIPLYKAIIAYIRVYSTINT